MESYYNIEKQGLRPCYRKNKPKTNKELSYYNKITYLSNLNSKLLISKSNKDNKDSKDNKDISNKKYKDSEKIISDDLIYKRISDYINMHYNNIEYSNNETGFASDYSDSESDGENF